MRVRGSETVLAVDDDPVMLELVSKVLKPFGYNVIFASSGEEALDVAASLQEKKIDLLLTDVILPGIKGQELAKQLLDSYPEVSVLFMSGYMNTSIIPGGVLEPGIHLIQKPFSLEELAARIRKVLDGPADR